MSPEDAIAMLDRQLAKHGEDIRLQRLTTGPNGVRIPFEVICRARVRAHEPQELILMGGEAPNTHVVISPTEIAKAQWPGPGLPRLPIKDDRIFIQDGHSVTTLPHGYAGNVEIVSPFYIGDQLVRIELECRGMRAP